MGFWAGEVVISVYETTMCSTFAGMIHFEPITSVVQLGVFTLSMLDRHHTPPPDDVVFKACHLCLLYSWPDRAVRL